MREDDESASRSSSGAGSAGNKTKKTKKKKTHAHIGPNARAYRAGRAMCPVCDAEKIIRITEKEREADKAVWELKKKQSSRA